MASTCQRIFAVLVAAATLSAAGASAQAAPLYFINSNNAQFSSAGTPVATARYLLSNTNYDINITNSTSSVTPTNIVTGNLGNNATLSGRTFEFTLEHRAGEGFIFSLTSPAAGSSSALSSTVAWGTFSTSLTGNVAASLNGDTPDESFNVISLFARGDRNQSSMAFENLSFSSTTLSLADGGFVTGVASTSAGGTPTGFFTNAPTTTAFNQYTQSLVSTADLSQHDWTLTGSLTGARVGSGGDAQVAFEIKMRNATVAVIPEPSMAILPLTGLLLVRRRR